MAFRINTSKVRDGLTIFERQMPNSASHAVFYASSYHTGKEFQRTTKIKVEADTKILRKLIFRDGLAEALYSLGMIHENGLGGRAQSTQGRCPLPQRFGRG